MNLNSNGTFTYTPTAGFTGTDSFTYEDSDGLLSSNVATVLLSVTARAPVSNNDTYSVAHDTVLAVSTATNSYYGGTAGVLANDVAAGVDTLTALLVSTTQHGTLTLNGDGTFTYTPAAAYYGTDSFTYRAADGALTGNVATATINVTETAPVAAPDTYTIAHTAPCRSRRLIAGCWPTTTTPSTTR
ncbi:MAG: Ig-like domain-containing protein [Isosphaerales bacterium]